MAESLPDKLRSEVAAAQTEGSVSKESNPTSVDHGDRLAARHSIVSSLVTELTLKLKSTVVTAEAWNALREAGDPATAVEQCLTEKIAPLTSQSPSSFAENEALCVALDMAIAVAREVEAWPAGMDAFEEMQGLHAGLAGLIKTEDTNLRSAAGLLGASEMHGMCALLWLNRGLVDVDLGSSTIRPSEVVSLIRVLPDRICSLSLADTDFARGGKDLMGLRAVCNLLEDPSGCNLRTLNLARNRLPSEAGEMLTSTIRCNSFALTSLNICGNDIRGTAAHELASAVLESPTVKDFSGLSIPALRADEVSGELDCKGKGLQAPEAIALATLIPGAPKLQSVIVDDCSLPIKDLGAAPDAPNALQDLQLPKSALSIASAAILGSVLARNSPLLILNLNYNKLGADGAEFLAEGCRKNTTLRTLCVAWNRIGPVGLMAIADMLADNKTLTELDIASNEVCGVNSFGQGTFDAEGMSQLADNLSQCALRVLDLSGNFLTGLNGRSMGKFNNEAVARLASGLTGSQITSLLLDGNQLGSMGTITMAAGIETMDTLQELGFADCHATDTGKDLTGLSRLVTALRNNKQFSLLNLDGNEIGFEGSVLLVPWLREAENLRSLHIDRGGNRLNEAAEKELKDACLSEVMLHLERARPSYEAAMIRAATLKQATASSALPSVASTPATADAVP